MRSFTLLSFITVMVVFFISPFGLSTHFVKGQGGFLTYCNSDIPLSIIYPLTWKVNADVENRNISFISPDGITHAEVHFTQYNVMNQPPDPKVAASAKLQSYEGVANNHLTPLGGGPINFKPQSDIIPPPSGYYIEYAYQDPVSGQTQGIEVFATDNTARYVAYDIAFYTTQANFASYMQTTFNPMISSFEPALVC
jgi:hypothetical protein